MCLPLSHTHALINLTVDEKVTVGLLQMTNSHIYIVQVRTVNRKRYSSNSCYLERETRYLYALAAILTAVLNIVADKRDIIISSTYTKRLQVTPQTLLVQSSV